MKKAFWILNVCLALPIWGAVSVPLTVQEALYTGGTTGVARTDEPFCMGVPLADSAGITSTGVLTLSGASAGQFRMLGTWPDGKYKWVKVCGIVPSLSAGGTATVTLADGGTGNFGGPNLATDNGSTITVSTGTATFTVKKANFNGIDAAAVGATQVLVSSSSANRGLVMMGPNPVAAFPANVTCGNGGGQSPCTTLYSSANDPNSTCLIEENGPVMAVLKCNGTHLDGAGHPYMHFTVREFFYKNKAYVKATSILRNADYDTVNTPSADCNLNGNGVCGGQTYNTAYKGFQSYELRLSPNIGGTLNYSFGNDTNNPTTGTLSQGSDYAYLYQGQVNYMIDPSNFCGYQSTCANLYSSDLGYTIRKNATTAASGGPTQIPAGWADISNASGIGVTVGIYQMAAYFPKSLEFTNGGNDVRIGIWASENGNPNGGPGNGTVPQYQAWPAWSIHDLFLEFHATSPASPGDDFLRFQHYLVARAPLAYYNSAAVFPYTMADPADEDSFMANVAVATSNPPISKSLLCYNNGPACVPDMGITSNLVANGYNVAAYKHFYWGNPGPRTQEEFRWSDVQMFLKRGYTGRFLNSAHFYRFQSEKAYAHADGTVVNGMDATINGFAWRNRPSNEIGTGYGWPYVVGGGCGDGMTPGSGCSRIANSTKAWVDFPDALHAHEYGTGDFYMLTGDETIREAYTARKDYYLNTTSYMGGHYYNNGGGVWFIRTLGIYLMGASRMYEYLTSIGDPDADAVLASGVQAYTDMVPPDLCVTDGAGNKYPAGCTPDPKNGYGHGGNYDSPGVSKVRGAGWTPVSRGQGWCGLDNSTTYIRWYQPFTYSLYVEGLLALRKAKGPSWSEYENSLDLAYGVSSWMLTEVYQDNGSNSWFDVPNTGARSNGGVALHNGFMSALPIDFPAQCNAPGGPGGSVGTDYGHGPLIQFGGSGAIYDPYAMAAPTQGMYMLFLPQILVNGSLTPSQQRQFKLAIQNAGGYNGNAGSVLDIGQYQMGTIINAVQHPSGATLQDVPFTAADLGGGNYRLSWTEIAGTQSYRVKWCCQAPYNARTIVNSGGYSTVNPSAPGGLLGYDNQSAQTFSLNPSTYMTWFGANGIGSGAEPVPGTVNQSITVATGLAGLTAANFSVKAMVGAVVQTGAATNLVLVSGNGQTGTVGQQLASPFVVKVTDANGNPVSGTSVSFTVTGGGGSVTVSSATTDGAGQASTTLTLGSTAGTNTVLAASGTLIGSPITFSATGTAGGGAAANLVLVSGNGQTGTPGQSLASPLVVKVTDANGNPVAGTSVSFTVTAGGGSLTASFVSTNSQGLASSTLTLGATAGTNTVIAASGTLAGSPLTFTATGVNGGTTGVTWTNQPHAAGWPGYVSWLTTYFTPISHQTLIYAKLGTATGIYSTDLFGYASGTNTMTHITGTGSPIAQCPLDTDTMPGDRHPDQMAMDARRLWLIGGANQTCKGSLGDGSPRVDMYYWTDNANIASGTWTRARPAHFPNNVTLTFESGMAWDSDHNVLFMWGYDAGGLNHTHWQYCSTLDNPTPGVLTAAQVTANCTLADDWSEIVGWTCAGPDCTGNQPPGISFPTLIYDPVTHRFIEYGGSNTGTTINYNKTFAFDLVTKTWTEKCLSGCTPPAGETSTGANTGQYALAYNTSTHKIVYHQSIGGCAPCDWSYDPAADTWTQTGSGSGYSYSSVTGGQVLAYDSVCNCVVGWSLNTTNGEPDIWTGSLSGGGTTQAGPCDLNKDGAVNVVDVQLGVLQALGTNVCGTADLNGDGVCNIIDVQRLINASLGGACKTGP